MGNFKCINLECNNFDKQTKIPEYTIKIVNGEPAFFINNKRIICPVCGHVYVRLADKIDGFTTSIATFNSKSPKEKREILKKRANAEWNRNKGMRDYADAAGREEV